MKPHLSIPLGALRPATAGDLDRIVGLLRDAHVRRYLCDDTILPRTAIADMLELSAQLDSRGLGLWAIEQGNNPLVGLAGLQPVSGATGAAPELTGGIEPIIALDPAFWRRNLASEALKVLTAYAREALRLSRLVAAVDEPNTRSHALLQRSGFSNTATIPGLANNLVLYELRLGDAKGSG